MAACLPAAAGNYLHGSSDPPRTLGNRFKSASDTDLDFHQISKRQMNTTLSSDSKLLETLELDATMLFSQFIMDSQLIKEAISVQFEKLYIDPMIADRKLTCQDDDDLIQRERAKKIQEQEDLFQAKKLSLVLDLDHTLLHSVRFDEIDSRHHERLIKKEERDQQKQQRHLFCLPHIKYWTKLRPGIWDFLEQASKLCELHICTMGGELYARKMAELLDPTGKYFGGRVVSKLGKGIKDLDEVLGMESTALIMDDTVKVWPNHMLHLIKVRKYTYFPYKNTQFNCPQSSLFERRRDERTFGGVLASRMEMIERVHQRFYSNPRTSLGEVDVSSILEEEKQKVIAHKSKSQHGRMLDSLGAVCTTEMNSLVTHVV